MEEVAFTDLIGKTLVSITGEQGGDEITMVTNTGETYKMFHNQDCCESVTIEDLVGDFTDLIGTPILYAEEATSNDDPKEYSDSWTWTFYHLSTVKGSVTIRWYGGSNGYYSESVSFYKTI